MEKKTIVKKDFSTGGVVWDAAEKKFLLIFVENLSGARVWTFPKGHPEKEETDHEAAVREVREETGWLCDVADKITDVHYYYVHDGITYNKTVRWFLMRPIEKVGDFDPEEVIEIKWVAPAEATKLITYASDKELLKQTSVLL